MHNFLLRGAFCLGLAAAFTGLSIQAENLNNDSTSPNGSYHHKNRRSPQSNSTTSSTETVSAYAPHTYEINVGPGMLVENGIAGFQINFGATTRVTRDLPLFVGADFGIGFAAGTEIQLLPTAIYKFDIPGVRDFSFFAGLSVGPTIVSQGGTVTNVNGGQVVSANFSASALEFEMLIRPGIEYTVAKNFLVSLEPKFGILSSSFVFLPQVNGVYTF